MPAWFLTAMKPERAIRSRAVLCWLAVLALAAPALAQLPERSTGAPKNNSQRVLSMDEAFPWHVSEAAPGQFRVVFRPAPEHYLYRHAFSFHLQTDAEERALAYQLPPGLEKNDQFFGDVVAYYNQVTVALEKIEDIPAGAALLIEFQGCADWGFCYPPQQARFELPPR